jgi:hypothetical protein
LTTDDHTGGHPPYTRRCIRSGVFQRHNGLACPGYRHGNPPLQLVKRRQQSRIRLRFGVPLTTTSSRSTGPSLRSQAFVATLTRRGPVLVEQRYAFK